MSKPNPGDRVRYTFEGYVRDLRLDVRYDLSRREVTLAWPTDAPYQTIEILERADDPARDPVGTVRRFGDATITVVWVKTDRDTWSRTPSQGIRSKWEDHAMVDASIIGVVPGTPAAAA